MSSDKTDELGIEESSKQKQIRRRKLYDRLARHVVFVGGAGIIFCIIAILFFIGIETVPLWKSPEKKLESVSEMWDRLGPGAAADKIRIFDVGVDEHREQFFTVDSLGSVRFFTLKEEPELLKTHTISHKTAGYISFYKARSNTSYAIADGEGRVVPFDVSFGVEFREGTERTVVSKVREREALQITGEPIEIFAYQRSPETGAPVVAAYTASGRLLTYAEVEEEGFLGESETEIFTADLTGELEGAAVTGVQIDSETENLYVSTENGKLYHWSLSDPSSPELKSTLAATANPGVAVTEIGFLLGHRSLIVGDAAGNVSVWFETTGGGGESKLTKIHVLPPLPAAVDRFSASQRGRGFLASDISGNISLYQATSATKQLDFPGGRAPYAGLTFSPKANGVVAVDSDMVLSSYYLDNPHPETNFRTLFGKIWYEGYDKPRYVWQSTGGTDEFEPKFSLTPLAYGTLKGAIYTMILSIPLAVLAAICVSQFLHPSIRNVVKPVIEVMAALPSVVLGFLAGLWLAPLLENIFVAIVVMPFIVIGLTLVMLFLWHRFPFSLSGRFRVGVELFTLVGVIGIAAALSLWLNGPLESLIFAGDFKDWFFRLFDLRYDQRNMLVVGFAMGFTVIPIIFTISEDALSSVPGTLSAGSLALGANRWQTAMRIVVPAASAGIFSAVMIGFGRAVGETMIVLMATGNTPVMDWSFFNGFRALSANIAVELPEAPHGGTLYRVLFLTAILLFVATFLLNTLAEILSQRLRRKYAQSDA
ncbi:MAG: ABC transporter permease subunit [Candidatus Dadabacteria bacterium]|nr:ABC transporter permease subunit [Candidatus Dadabacteria bacterium]MYA48553.1 ABC transporter permease subunit [Candidatus Dadabacteria bacterium]MYK49196.1 ABC transporter permease subunit [Candidatus Dadabacteria bacterium]